MELIQIINNSFKINKWKFDEESIKKPLDLIKNISWIYFLIYSFVISLFVNVANFFVNQNEFEKIISSGVLDILGVEFIELVNTYSMIGSLTEYIIYLLSGFILFYLGFLFLKSYFKIDISFSHFYKIITFVLLPSSLILVLLKISQLLSINFTYLTFLVIISYILLVYFSFLGLISLLNILSKRFKTDYINFIMVIIGIGVVISLIFALVIIPSTAKLSVTTTAKITIEAERIADEYREKAKQELEETIKKINEMDYNELRNLSKEDLNIK
ncbi:MAG: hypothetical protein KC550_00170 [Nanoarchaeota archaeon]|nr:hypothetical protein [Nanoarchaeota archaeon]